jgi:hypothetical protein
MKNRPEFIVFSGFNNRAVIAFCRAATKHGVPFHIVARCGADPIPQTSYGNKVVCQAEDVLALDVKDLEARSIGDYHGRESGPLRPKLEWVKN